MEDIAFRRASILIEQNRWPDAERELRTALANDPQSAEGHALLSLVLLEQLKLNDATELAQRAIVLDPDEPFAHFALAAVLEKRNRYADALIPLNEAIRLDPFDPKLHALMAQIKLAQRNWPAALEAANRGLEIDPNHDACVNLRGMALVHLGRRGEASATIDGALERDPENTITHANQGWALLHRNQPKQAMEHFREALRLDPTNDWAKAGIVEAMKARNPLYRVLLAYFLFMARRSSQVQLGIIVGGYIGYRALLSFQQSNPQFAAFTMPIIALYVIFALSTWLAPALANLLLRLDRFGRHALSSDQTWTSNIVGGLLLIAFGTFLGFLATGTSPLLTAALFTGLLAIPASIVFVCDAGWPRWTAAGITIALALVGAGEVAYEFARLPDEVLSELFRVFTWGVFLSQFVMQGLAQTKVRR